MAHEADRWKLHKNKAAENIATLCSLLATCKAQEINSREWLNDIIAKLPYYLEKDSGKVFVNFFLMFGSWRSLIRIQVEFKYLSKKKIIFKSLSDNMSCLSLFIMSSYFATYWIFFKKLFCWELNENTIQIPLALPPYNLHIFKSSFFPEEFVLSLFSISCLKYIVV